MMPSRLAILTVFALLIVGFVPVSSLAQTEISDPTVDYIFGEKVYFQAKFRSQEPVSSAFIFFQPAGSIDTEAHPVTVQNEGDGLYNLGFESSLTAQPLRAFSRVSYRYEITLQNGDRFKSSDYDFLYEDNRFAWKTLEEEPFRVHWFEGELPFAQDILDVAQAGLERVQSILNLPAPQQVEIYVYSSSTKMQDTLARSGLNWVAGHADPDLGVMVVALPAGPEQHLLMEQRIPHELMHIMLYESIGPSYNKLPTWLNEGLASVAELYPNPDYQILLDNAHEKQSFLPIASLCQAFPRDASNALLAYAQAASFTRYLHRMYGMTGLLDLINAYANGVTCERGTEVALGRNLTQIERQWRQQTFAENAALAGLKNLLPWAILMLLALTAPLGLALGRLRSNNLRSLPQR